MSESLDAKGPPPGIPRYRVVGKIEFDMSREEMDGLRREIDKRGIRTPEELKIANDAWFNCGPGEAPP
jgi:hypothetical protein